MCHERDAKFESQACVCFDVMEGAGENPVWAYPRSVALTFRWPTLDGNRPPGGSEPRCLAGAWQTRRSESLCGELGGLGRDRGGDVIVGGAAALGD